MNYFFSSQISTKVLFSQLPMTPESVAVKSLELQSAMVWGLRVSSFIISLFILASIVRYILDISKG